MLLDDVLREVDDLLDAFVLDEPLPGVAYGVMRDGELIHTRGVGTTPVGNDRVPTPDTIFRIASMTESFTSATMLLLRDDGPLHLDAPVATYVPELAGTRPITLRQLMTMSSGLPTDDPWGDREQDLDLERFAAFLAGGQAFAWRPGTEFELSGDHSATYRIEAERGELDLAITLDPKTGALAAAEWRPCAVRPRLSG